MKRGFKRRQYPVVFRDRQFYLLSRVLLYSLTLVAILFVFLFLPDFFQMRDESADVILRGQAADRVLMLHARLWPAILMAICFIGLHSFRLFLRFIGPLKRLDWAFDKMKSGDLAVRVVLRDGDFMIEEGDSLNETIQILSSRMRKVKAAAAETRTALKDLGAEIDALPPESRAYLTASLQTLQGSVDAELRCLDYFKTSEPNADSPETA